MTLLRTGWVATGMALLAATMLLAGCPKKPQTSTQTATLPETRSEAPPPPIEDVSPIPPVAEERPSEPPPAETGGTALADVFFEFDRAEITPAARTVLEQNAKWLMSRGGTAEVRIEGHCDERGTNEYNLALGERRAQAVKRVLVALGVPAARLTTISYGEEQLACREAQESCYQKNRRAHLAIR